jgi:ribosome-associated heat shock protein Hsp15
MEKEQIRIDKYLWAIRVFKTRSLATEACVKGNVKLNGNHVKASKTVMLGDVYKIKAEHRNWEIKVLGIVFQRVQYAEAIKYYEDLTPMAEFENQKLATSAFVFDTGKRQNKQARPTKKQRRDLDDYLES